MRSNHHKAFSLLEIVFSIGIFATAALTIMMLLGTLVGSSQESWRETRAAQIARQIVLDLRPNPAAPSDAADQATGEYGVLVTAADPVQVALFPEVSPFVITTTYDIDGIPVDEDSPEATFHATLTMDIVEMDPAVGASGSARRMGQAMISIRPAAQPDARPFRYVTRFTPSSL